MVLSGFLAWGPGGRMAERAVEGPRAWGCGPLASSALLWLPSGSPLPPYGCQ